MGKIKHGIASQSYPANQLMSKDKSTQQSDCTQNTVTAFLSYTLFVTKGNETWCGTMTCLSMAFYEPAM